jgi:hypothetical protein
MSDFLSVNQNGNISYVEASRFFWLGDTAWLLSRKLSFPETKLYLEIEPKRVSQLYRQR